MNAADPRRRGVLLMVPMLGAAAAARWLEPGLSVSLDEARIDLGAIVPASFVDWRIDPLTVPIQPSPDVQALLDRLYSATLSRTYVDSAGRRVMLSLAYGRDQGRALQVHKPEACYVGQGFSLSRIEKTVIEVNDLRIPSMRLLAQKSSRIEPVTYWIRVGDAVVRGWFEQNLWRLRFGLSGTIPDGLLVRVSSLSTDVDAAFALQRSFLGDLFESLGPDARRFLAANGRT